MDLLDRLLGHDAWTTRLLLQRCGELTDEHQIAFALLRLGRPDRGEQIRGAIRNADPKVQAVVEQLLGQDSELSR